MINSARHCSLRWVTLNHLAKLEIISRATASVPSLFDTLHHLKPLETLEYYPNTSHNLGENVDWEMLPINGCNVKKLVLSFNNCTPGSVLNVGFHDNSFLWYIGIDMLTDYYTSSDIPEKEGKCYWNEKTIIWDLPHHSSRNYHVNLAGTRNVTLKLQTYPFLSYWPKNITFECSSK